MVETSNDTAAYLLRQIYDKTKIQSREDFDFAIVAEYFGDINEKSIATLSEGVEKNISQIVDNRKIIKRIFTVFIEGMQNIYKHGAKDEEGKHMGACLITKSEKAFRIHFFNFSAKEEMASMTEYLAFLNGLNMKQTKKFYMERLVNGKISSRGGASLGYITMKLKSNNNIKYSFESSSDLNACFHIELQVDLAETE